MARVPFQTLCRSPLGRLPLNADSCSIYFSLFLCGIDMSLFPSKTLSCLRGVPLLFLSCEGAQRLQSGKDRRPDAVGGKGEVSSRCTVQTTSKAPRLIGSGFNGAATNRSRKQLAELALQNTTTELQWGRNQSVAETGGAGWSLPTDEDASMGPQPIGRGNGWCRMVPTNG